MQLLREAGWSLAVRTPAVDTPQVHPPGQGHLLVVMRGAVEVREFSGVEGRVVETPRPARVEQLPFAALFSVPNDARWTIRAMEPGAVVLDVGTSVPRARRTVQQLDRLARRRVHMGPRALYANESMRMEFSALRGLIPFRGWVPYDHVAECPEVAVVLAGELRARLRGEAGGTRLDERLEPGAVLRIPPGVAHNFAARGRGTSIGLILSGLRRFSEATPNRDEARGFDPFR